MFTVGMLKKILEEVRVPDDMELVINIDGDQVGIYKLRATKDDYIENRSVLEIIADCSNKFDTGDEVLT